MWLALCIGRLFLLSLNGLIATIFEWQIDFVSRWSAAAAYWVSKECGWRQQPQLRTHGGGGGEASLVVLIYGITTGGVYYYEVRTQID